MRYRRPNSSAVLETRIDYVESRLDDTINNFKEAMQKSESKLDESISSLKEAITKSESNFKEAMQQMENRHQANFTELKSSLEKSIAKAESLRRWVVGLVITVAVAVIGFILTNGFQIQF